MYSTVFFSELIGTSVLTLLGCSVIANVSLEKTKGNNEGFLLVNLGWGIAVFVGVYVAYKSGAHLNPAVTISRLFGNFDEFAPGIKISKENFFFYLCGQFLGAFIGSVICWILYKDHFDIEKNKTLKLDIFATRPSIENNLRNLITELIATFVLIFWILNSSQTPSQIGPLAVAIAVIGIGASLGGPTGCAINPARDLGPRIAHAVLPIKNKRDSNWKYAWIPVVGPMFGAILAGIIYSIF